MAKKDKPLPKTLGACADELKAIKDEMSGLNRELAELQARRTLLETKLIEELPASNAEGIVGKTIRATVVTKRVPVLEDWAAFTKHIKKTGDFDLLRRQVSTEAVEERWEAKKRVPGVGVFNKKKVSLTKK